MQTVTVIIPHGYQSKAEFLADTGLERVEPIKDLIELLQLRVSELERKLAAYEPNSSHRDGLMWHISDLRNVMSRVTGL